MRNNTEGKVYWPQEQDADGPTVCVCHCVVMCAQNIFEEL